MIKQSTLKVNMGCMDKNSCPTLFLPNVIDRDIEDPKGKSIEKVREIRDVVEARVKELVSSLIQDSRQAYIYAMIATFALLVVFVNGVGVRHVSIIWKEKVETTIAFRNVNGVLKVVGLKGTTQIHPTLVSRTGDTAYALTVINQDTTPHIFFIVNGLNLHTKIIRPGQNDTITIYPKSERTYNYYDWVTRGKSLGQFKAVKVRIGGGD